MAFDMKTAGQETVKPEGRHAIDETALTHFLARELPGFEGQVSVTKFGYGQSNPTYLLETTAGKQYVLRKRPPGKLIKSAHAVDREYRIMRALGTVGFQVPRVHLLCEDEAVLGTSFYVMDFVRGPIVDNALLQAIPEERRGIMMSIVRTLARLHSYDPAALGLLQAGSAYGRLGGFYERQIATMSRTSDAQVAGSAGMVPPMRSFRPLLDMFRAHMPEDKSCIIHGDWKPDNMILSQDPGPKEVVAVLDWELSTIGHPMSDLANLCLAYHMPAGNPVGYPAFDTSPGSGIPAEDEVHRAYCEAAGVTYPIVDWSFFVAFACLRLSVIAQGVAMRVAKGQSSALGAASEEVVRKVVAAAEFMCDLGFDIMRKARGESSKL